MTVRPLGERAWLVDRPGVAEVLALRAALRARPLPGQVDVVAGARSVLVRLDRPIRPSDLTRLAEPVEVTAVDGGGRVVLDTVYDGPDLAEVAALTGLTVPAVVAAHAATRWWVAFTGFAPGFGYLVPDRAPWQPLPRRASPRTRVPVGAVAAAGEFSGVYPRESPGGWQLLGRTAAPLWRPDRPAPALLVPGTEVRFRPVDAVAPVDPAPAPIFRAGPDERPRALVVRRPGLLTTVQDGGRPGRADLGVPVSGAADRGAAAAANRCLGNDAGAAVLETTLGGLVLAARGALRVAVTGAPLPVWVDGSEQMVGVALDLPDGAELRLGRPAAGLRNYLAVEGGIDVPPVLGSRSTDLLSGLGSAPLRAGDVLPVGPAGGRPGPVDPGRPLTDRLEVLPGPRPDWFAEDAVATLTGTDFTVSPQSNRVGLRLTGASLRRARSEEWPSEGLVPGAVQVPPSGEPVVFLADHPVTGGYPVVAVLTEEAVDRAAQLRPGDRVRFRSAPAGPALSGG